MVLPAETPCFLVRRPTTVSVLVGQDDLDGFKQTLRLNWRQGFVLLGEFHRPQPHDSL